MKGAVPYVRHPVKAVAVHNGPTGTWPLVPKGGRTEAFQVSQADQAPVSLIPGRLLDQHGHTHLPRALAAAAYPNGAA